MTAMRFRLLLGFLLGFAPGIALGIGRFAYALILPEMQSALGLSYAQAGLIGSANTAGYFLGALLSHRILYATGYKRGLYASLWLQTLTLILMIVSPSLAFLMLLRFIQGFFGALIFVGGAALLLASGGRSIATGLYFGGVGIGILLSTLILPFMTSWQMGWLALAVIAVLMTGITYLIYPKLKEPEARNAQGSTSLKPIRAILIAYGIYGAGYIGYMTFVTTGLSQSLALFWIVLGLGSTSTGLIWGPLMRKIGGERTLIIVLASLAGSSFYWLVLNAPWVSAFVFGLGFLGVITCITDIIRQTLPTSDWARAMGVSTAIFALGQAVGPSLSGIAGDLLNGSASAIGLSTVFLSISVVFSIYAAFKANHNNARA